MRLVLRRVTADTVTLCVRYGVGAPWVPVTSAAVDDAPRLAELNRLQTVYQNPLVREIFLDLTEQEAGA